MGTSSVMKSSTVVAALVMVVLFGTCASVGANCATLRVENARLGDDASNITVLHPPGCCDYCTAEVCPEVCEDCKDVVVESGKKVKLEPRVGPYPLPYLNIGVEGEVYCVPEEFVQYLTRTALLQVGYRADPFCIRTPHSIHARIVDANFPGPPDSGRREICLRACKKQKESSS